MRPERAFVVVALLCACEHAGPAGSEKTAKEIAAPIERTDQYALLADIRDARAVDRSERDLRYAEVTRAWRGRRVRWDVGVLEPLCARPDACVVLPFDNARLDERSGQGWLPRIELDAEEHARIRDACAQRAESRGSARPQGACVITVEASVKGVRLTSELPVAVTLEAARMISARSAGPAESWARAPVHPSLVGRAL